MGYYLAIDIGEKIGHHIMGYLENDKLQLNEIYRFENSEGENSWNLSRLFDEIKYGMKKCREISSLPILIGIDTWGTHFVLLDNEDKILGNMIDINYENNFIKQLTFMKEKNPDYPEKAKTLLMMPDYLNFLLTGEKLNEYTSAMTTQLVNPETQKWNKEFVVNIGFSAEILQDIKRPGAVIGNLTRMVTEEVGYDCIVVLPATHAESSAIFALSRKEYKTTLNNPESGLLRKEESEMKYSAAAIGNLLVQMIISHEIKDIQAAHICIKNSFII